MRKKKCGSQCKDIDTDLGREVERNIGTTDPCEKAQSGVVGELKFFDFSDFDVLEFSCFRNSNKSSVFKIVNDPNQKQTKHNKTKIKIKNKRKITSKKDKELLLSVALGQVLSLLICGIGLTSKYLSEDFHANTPVFQSFLNYILLFLVYTTTLAVRQGEENLLAILKRRWWKYMILGIIDIEANYLVVKAYQYTTLTSVQLLDCFVIPVVILLSWFFLLVRYKAVHFIGIVVCILGMGCMAGADVLVGRQQGAGENKLIGDLLVLGGATLYGISNVCEEYIVRNLSRVEFLGMIGLFGSFFSGIQLAIMEHKELLKVPWDWQIGLLYVGFSACMFGLYSFMPVVIKKTSATAVNLSLLTADLYSLFCGLFLFHYK
ncbi:solute carrier family 35 member F1, partial [Alligator sinensis]|uniref:Solute carrier family 35 member F1 n=1 Tax=Alligator sinensis TaxID=38654 RepID=A0A1U8DVL5_ALLSI